ncbi:MAG: ABC transporter ATP-binding protein [Thermodesulfobacteriota bacterium]|jgi:iron complex transport system ATP-binding protein
MTPLVTIHNLAFSYDGDITHAIFRDVTFSVGPGDIFCLLGPNGTGKSTLLKCVSNVLQGWQGSILFDEREISRMKPSDVAKGIGYVPQNQVSTFPFLVKDIVVMGRAPHLSVFSSPNKKDRTIAYGAMKTVGILSLSDRPCTTLSGGEWQLTLIARALAQEPRIMVLDEPTSHLDLGNQVKILRVVKELAETGLAIIMASHFPDHAFLVSSEVAILNRGHIEQKGIPEKVITDENLKDTYGVEVKVLYIGEGVNRKACFPSLKEPSSRPTMLFHSK